MVYNYLYYSNCLVQYKINMLKTIKVYVIIPIVDFYWF